MTKLPRSAVSRREFLHGTAAVAGVSLAPTSFHVSGNDEVRVGLIGCGGRGSGAALNALKASKDAKLVAMGDLFADRMTASHERLKGGEAGDRVLVPAEQQFSGIDAYKGVIANSDVVLLAATPHFRPQHLKAAIDAGKHVFCEKPVAVDGPGLRSVMETCEVAKKKQLNVVSGLCYRYDQPKQELIERVHDGAVGDIVALECTYNTGGLWHRKREENWTDMEFQIRNWLYFTWLSGDHIAEQSIHSIDKILWAMKDEAPAKVTASGGRSTRTDPKYGNVYDHFNTVFEWANGVKLFHSCRQWQDASSNVSDYVYGTKGTAAIQQHKISGDNEWRFRGRSASMYQREHDALFAAIQAGTPINNGDYMCKSTLMALMGRMAAYTGQTITWDQALSSTEDLTPKSYDFGPAPEVVIARPGVTKFS